MQPSKNTTHFRLCHPPRDFRSWSSPNSEVGGEQGRSLERKKTELRTPGSTEGAPEMFLSPLLLLLPLLTVEPGGTTLIRYWGPHHHPQTWRPRAHDCYFLGLGSPNWLLDPVGSTLVSPKTAALVVQKHPTAPRPLTGDPSPFSGYMFLGGLCRSPLDL